MDETTLLAKASHATFGGQSLYEVTLVKFIVCLFGWTKEHIFCGQKYGVPVLTRELLRGFSILSGN